MLADGGCEGAVKRSCGLLQEEVIGCRGGETTKGVHCRCRMSSEGHPPTSSLYLQVIRGLKQSSFEERNWRTFLDQTKAPIHVGDLS